ncbi:hypothetical protein KIH74_32190 [Kineosporia sp. J2-2]|uniref:Anti-sigma-K factor rskA n=1 Tax=Kineosporia corallincola TaxID=2835133 RepID=A0ABS5TSA3_9ACTN|nr:hypothetical protein [Kineosporia corallincola]MBT0773649.1 hypothetical protein [Kineosporia corallincola]
MNIETELREVLADEATFAGDMLDPYGTFIRRETKRRRARRLRLATGMAAVVAGVVAVAGVQVYDGRHSAPALPAIVSSQEGIPGAALLSSPLRGSLAQDEAFIEAMQPRVSASGDVTILYASDVGDQRLVLAWAQESAQGTAPHPTSENGFLVWFAGPSGASAQKMQFRQRSPLLQGASSFVEASNDAEGLAVVIGPQGYTAEVSSNTSSVDTAQDTVGKSTPLATGATGSGVVETVLPPQSAPPTLTGTLIRDGQRTSVTGDGMTWSETTHTAP